MINPLSPEVTAVGIAYSKRVSHQHVRADVHRLLSASGWIPEGSLTITDESADHTRPAVPITTAARLLVSSAPQVVGNAPSVTPYVRAFQAMRNVELVFIIPDLNPYRGVERYDTPALSVNMIRNEGVYRYEVEIRDHKATVPWLASTVPAPSAPPASTDNPTVTSGKSAGGSDVATMPPGRVWLASVLLISGTAILAGLGIYSLRHRGAPRAL